MNCPATQLIFRSTRDLINKFGYVVDSISSKTFRASKSAEVWNLLEQFKKIDIVKDATQQNLLEESVLSLITSSLKTSFPNYTDLITWAKYTWKALSPEKYKEKLIEWLTKYSEDPLGLLSNFHKNVYKRITEADWSWVKLWIDSRKNILLVRQRELIDTKYSEWKLMQTEQNKLELNTIQKELDYLNAELESLNEWKMSMLWAAMKTLWWEETNILWWSQFFKWLLRITQSPVTYAWAQILVAWMEWEEWAIWYWLWMFVPQLWFYMTHLKSWLMWFKTSSKIIWIRQKYWILFNEKERIHWWPFTVENIKKKVNNVKEAIFPFVYNVADVIIEARMKNKIFDLTIKEDYKYWSLEEMDRKLDLLRKTNSELYTKEVSRIIENVNKRYTWLRHYDAMSNSTYYTQKRGSTQKLYDYTMWFLWGWWNLITRNSIKVLQELDLKTPMNWWIRQDYIETMQNFWQHAAFDKVMNYYMRNDEFLKMTTSRVRSMQLWFYADRIERWQTGEDFSLIWALIHSAHFNKQLQALNSIPTFRAFKNSLQTMLWISNSEYSDEWNTATVAGMNTFEIFSKEVMKRFLNVKVIASLASDWWNRQLTMESFWEAIMNAAWWYLYYWISEKVKWWIPINTTYPMNMMFWWIWVWNKDLEDLIELWKQKKLDDQLRRAEWYFKSWVWNNLPVLSSRTRASFWDDDDYAVIYDKYKNDPEIANMNAWLWINLSKYPWTLELVYNYITQLNKHDKKEKDWSYSAFTRTDFYWLYKKSWWETNWNFTDQDSLFVWQALKNLTEWQKDEFLKNFDAAMTTKDKVWVQMLAFMEASSPWSWKEILWFIVAEQFDRYLKNNPRLYKYKWDEFKERTRRIRQELWKRYWNLLYDVDKKNFMNLELAILWEKYPEVQDKLTDHEWRKDVWIKKQWHTDLNKEWKQKADMAIKWMFFMQMLWDIELYNWNINWPKLVNNYYTISSEYINYDQDPQLTKMLVWFLKQQVERIDNMSWTDLEKSTAKQALMLPHLWELWRYSKNPEFVASIWQDVIDDVAWLVYWELKTFKDIKEYESWLMEEQKFLEEIKSGNKQVKPKDLTKEFYDLQKTSWKNTDYYYNNGWTYNNILPKNYQSYNRMNNVVYDAFKNAAQQFTYKPKTYGNYATRTMNQRDRDYLQEYSRVRGQFYQNFRNLWKDYWWWKKWFEKPETRLSQQKQWFAIPNRLREMPRIYKDTERDLQQTMKQWRKRSAVKYDAWWARKSVIKWSISSPKIVGRSWVSSNARTKGGHTWGSKNKTRNIKGNKQTKRVS